MWPLRPVSTAHTKSLQRTSGVVGDVARRKDQRGRLLVQRGQLLFQSQVQARVAGNVARATSSGSVGVERLSAEKCGDPVSRVRQDGQATNFMVSSTCGFLPMPR
jgi:hypothetical protein